MAYKTKREAKYAAGKGSLKNRIKYMEKQRPEYDIATEAIESQELAKRQAFGELPEITAARAGLEAGVAETMGEATKVTESGSSLLATLEAINAQKQKGFLNLAGQEASIRSQKMGDLYRQNYAMIEEKDKAFEYNVAAPYAQKLTGMREQKRQRTENWMKAADIVGGIIASRTDAAASMATGGAG